MFHFMNKSIKASQWPLERLGLCSPCSYSLRATACVFSAYHAVKRHEFTNNLEPNTISLSNDHLLIAIGLFAETLWVEANEVNLKPIRFRPTMQEIQELRGGTQASLASGVDPADL